MSLSVDSEPVKFYMTPYLTNSSSSGYNKLLVSVKGDYGSIAFLSNKRFDSVYSSNSKSGSATSSRSGPILPVHHSGDTI